MNAEFPTISFMHQDRDETITITTTAADIHDIVETFQRFLLSIGYPPKLVSDVFEQSDD
jgi:hypothetical protein